jgi:ubiquinone/menaquinone biosynthesis C-methylase UbiE
MDHAAVNESFVTDFLAAMTGSLPRPSLVLDIGAGTALIPVELCRCAANLHVVAVDAAHHMLATARRNVAAAGLADRIQLIRADAKELNFGSCSFDAVISNSILHHIAEPRQVIAEALRVARPGAIQFHRDLCRPGSNSEVERLVSLHGNDATPYQQKLLADSLQASLALDEIRSLVVAIGFAPETVQMTSDRHWTWSATHYDLRK